jgi:hypothetical protein
MRCDCGINCGRKDLKTPHKAAQHSITISPQSTHNARLAEENTTLTKTLDLNFESAASAIPPLRHGDSKSIVLARPAQCSTQVVSLALTCRMGKFVRLGG